MAPCAHLDSVTITQLPESVEGCVDCLAQGSVWLHLRICLSCGHVGCCDDSPQQHASHHAEDAQHPIIRSLQPDEDWSYCFIENMVMNLVDVKGHTKIPPSPMLG
jgi:uncharacterized UBP type Zn finger protein